MQLQNFFEKCIKTTAKFVSISNLHKIFKKHIVNIGIAHKIVYH